MGLGRLLLTGVRVSGSVVQDAALHRVRPTRRPSRQLGWCRDARQRRSSGSPSWQLRWGAQYIFRLIGRRVRSWLLNSHDRWQTRSLRRSVAPIVGVVLALSFMGVGIGLAVRRSAHTSSYVVVWVRPGTSVAQREAILRALRSTDGVIACYYWSQRLDYLQAQTLIPKSVSGDLTPETTPGSIRCAGSSQRVPREVFATWVGKPGVYSVTPGYPAGGLTPP